MTASPPDVVLSPLDEERFGVRTARVGWMTLENLSAALDFCRDNGVALLMANCRSTERSVIPAMEDAGFRLMDTIVSLERDLAKPLPAPGNVLIRTVRAGEEDAVAAVAAQAFGGYRSHYHADPRLDPARCAEVYPDWVRRTCLERGETTEVIVADVDGAVTGLVLMRVSSPDETISPLAGVLPDTRRQGVLYSLAVRVLEWSASKGAKRTFAQVQLTNVPMQRAIQRVGFEPSYSFHTFHKWFE